MAARGEFTVKARIEAEDRASGPLNRVQGSFDKFRTFITTVWVVGILGALTQVRRLFDLVFDDARLKGQTQALRIQLAQQGQAFDTYIARLNEVARGTVSTASLIQSSSQALLLGIPADKIAKLLEIARASAIATGQSTAAAFDAITTGIGRASPMILDNLGFVVKLGPAYETMAASIGKAADQLTVAEQKTALLNVVLEQGEPRIAAFSEQQDKLANALERGNTAMENFRAALAGGITLVVGTMASGFALLALGVVKTAEAFDRFKLSVANFTGRSEEFKKAILSDIESLSALDKSITTFIDDVVRANRVTLNIGGLAGESQKAADEIASLTLSMKDNIARNEEMNAQFEATRFGTQKLGEAVDVTGDSFDETGVAAEGLTQRLRAQTAQLNSVTAAANAATVAIRGLGGGVGLGGPVNGGNRVEVLDRNGNRIGSRFVNAAGFGGSSRPSRFFPNQTTYR